MDIKLKNLIKKTRMNMETKLNRKLKAGEEVYYIDGNIHNTSMSNLTLLYPGDIYDQNDKE